MSRSRRRECRCRACRHSNTARFCDSLPPLKPEGATLMRKLALVLCLFAAATAFGQNKTRKDPTWWDKYQFILNNGPIAAAGTTSSVASGTNVDVSNEC